MSARIDARFGRLKAENRAGFIAYVMAGDPDAATALAILRGLPAAGADLIELGFPFSDPMAEGPTIQLASQRALKGRMTLKKTLELVKAFRHPVDFGDKLGEIEQVLVAAERKHDVPTFARLGPVDPWLVEHARGELDLSGFEHTLDVQSVRHTFRRHGKVELEAGKGQIAVTNDDFRKLPMLLREFDYVVSGLRTPQGQRALALVWEQPEGSTLSVQVVLSGRKRLETRTMWKWPGGARAAHLATVLSHHVRNEPQVDIRIIGRGTEVKARSAGDAVTPVILMGYLNPLLSYGYDRFAADAADAGVDGLIVVDCPPEEAGPLADALDACGLALIRLATPTSDDARLKVVTARTSGFVYYVSVAGVTGVGEANAAAVAPAVARVRAASGLPVAVGFGIRTPERAAEVARVADAAVVGSALVDEIAGALQDGEEAAPRVLSAAKKLADAVHAAREQRVGA